MLCWTQIRESLDNPNKFKPRNATALVSTTQHSGCKEVVGQVKEFFGQRWDKMDIQVKQDAVPTHSLSHTHNHTLTYTHYHLYLL